MNEARIGKLSAWSAEVLHWHGTLPAAAFSRDAKSDDEMKIIPTLIKCRNQEVDMANERENVSHCSGELAGQLPLETTSL